MAELAQNCIGFNVDAAQMLVDILSKGLYTADQTEQIQALAAHFGVEVSEDLSHLILYWDFRTGNLTDRIGGLKATASADVTMDAKGTHLDTNASYLMFPAGFDGASLAGHTAEIKFGQMSLNQTASTMRLLCVCSGNQPAVTGLQWNVQDCWSKGASLVTEFKDIDMFSGKILLCKCSADGTVLDFYFEDQLIVSATPTTGFTHLSIGSTTSAAFPLTVEYVRIYPTVGSEPNPAPVYTGAFFQPFRLWFPRYWGNSTDFYPTSCVSTAFADFRCYDVDTAPGIRRTAATVASSSDSRAPSSRSFAATSPGGSSQIFP